MKSKLGKGLGSLLSGSVKDDLIRGMASPESQAAEAGTSTSDGTFRAIDIEKLVPGKDQPRRDMGAEEIDELSESIRIHGLLQPIVVRSMPEGRFEIIAGERRWRAARKAGLSEVSCIVKDIDDKTAAACALIENIQRKDLNAMEKAEALSRIAAEYGLTHEEIADAIGKSRASVSNLIRLTELNDDVKKFVEDGRLEMGHARALLGLAGEQQSNAANQAVAKSLSVRETESLVKKLQKGVKTPEPPRFSEEDVNRWQNSIKSAVGCSGVKLSFGSNGKGRLVLSFASDDELTKIMAVLGKNRSDIADTELPRQPDSDVDSGTAPV